jgi:hypothetical protein
MIAPENVLTIDSISDFSEGRHGKGYRFSLHYMALDTASPYLIEVMEQENVSYADYEVLEDYTWEVYHLRLSAVISRQEYESIADSEKDFAPYLDDSMATDRVRQLAQDITKDAETDYDKAKAIEAYLRTYEYNTSVDYSKSENYIDEFLFETGKGYCVHYASSMVLMLRLCGIPAKYTVGYYHRDNAEHVIKSSEAHAWVQAYIDGIGWMDFEPTSSKDAPSSLRWSPVLAEDAGVDINEDDGSDGQTAGTVDIPDALEKPNVESENGHFAIPDNVRRYLIFLVAFCTLAVVGIIGGKKLRYLMMDERGKVRYDMNRLRRRLDKRLGVSPESIYEYLPLVEDYEKRQVLKETFDTYYRIRFRGDMPDPLFMKKLRLLAGQKF